MEELKDYFIITLSIIGMILFALIFVKFPIITTIIIGVILLIAVLILIKKGYYDDIDFF